MSCPTDKSLLQYVLGATQEDEAVKLEQHLANCCHCCETLDALHPSDTIVEAVRAARVPVVAAADVNEPLIDKLCRFGLAVAADSQPTVAMNPAEEQAAESHQQAATAERTVGVGPLVDPRIDDARQKATTAEACDFLAPPQTADELGRLGPYRVLQVLGTGGMGVVFRAEDPQLQRLVALKAMKPALAVSESARKRFLREARSTAAIEHDHIVSIHQVGEDRGVPFLAMQLLRGESLEDRCRRTESVNSLLPLADVLRIGREVALGLAAAHQRGLIHRDIKPGNIWLETRTGEPEGVSPRTDYATDIESRVRGLTPFGSPSTRAKILDFGLARAADDDLQLTQTGAVAGTPAYMSPEQAQGEHVDHRSDLFSLGAMLYRLCTGELPFPGANAMSILLAVASRQPKPPHELNSDVPPALSDLVLRLLAKQPADRPQTAREVVEAIAIIEHQTTAMPSVAGSRREPSPTEADSPAVGRIANPAHFGSRREPSSLDHTVVETTNPALGESGLHSSESPAAPISPASRAESTVGWPPSAVPLVGTGGKSQPTRASAPEHTPRPQTSGALRPPARRNRTSIALATAAVLLVLGPLSFYFGATVIRIATDKGQIVIENCFIRSAAIGLNITPGSAFFVRNSVIPMLMNQPSIEAGEGHIRIVRSIGWNPLGGLTSLGLLFGSHPTQCKIRLETDRSLFDAGVEILSFSGFPTADWKGSRCVYRQLTPEFLQSLKTRWQSTVEDSQELLPLVAEPRAWQLWEQSAGYRAGPDGKDFGADVTRVARTPELQPTPSERTPRALAAQSPDIPASVAPVPAKTRPDKEKPFVLVRASGAKREEFKHASEAFAVFRDGDTLEVHGNGPFPMPIVYLDGRNLTLRAAPGYRPRFVPMPDTAPARVDAGHGWFTLQRAGLHVEGCDFVGFTSSYLFDGDSSARELDVRNCRILGYDGAVFRHDSNAQVRFTNNLICGCLAGSATSNMANVCSRTTSSSRMVLCSAWSVAAN